MSKFCLSKKGFGLIEVMVAALVLGFLIVGLTRLQMGNRESILRVRDRDAANLIAQHVLDSISAWGMKAFAKECDGSAPTPIVQIDEYKYKFEGNKIETPRTYRVEVSCVEGVQKNEADHSTSFTSSKETISHSLKARVSWKHKGSEQAIIIAKVVK